MIASTLPLLADTPGHQSALLSYLKREMSLPTPRPVSATVAQPSVLDTAVPDIAVLDGYAEEVTMAMQKTVDEITDVILATCVVDTADQCLKLFR